MKYFLFIVLLIAVLITAGCTSGNQNVVAATTATPTATPALITATPILTPAIVTTKQVTPTETVDTLCGELIYCGYAAPRLESLPNYIKPIKSDRCNQLGILRQNNDQNVMACIKNPYEASGNSALELAHCMQGVGTLEYCYTVADRSGNIDRETMKKMWCNTNAC